MDTIVKRLVENRNRLNEVDSSWDPSSQENSYKVDIYLKKSGYELLGVSKDKELYIKPLVDKRKAPYIYHNGGTEYEVVVEDYGALLPKELEVVLQGYQNALEIIKYLSSLDLDELESDEEDE